MTRLTSASMVVAVLAGLLAAAACRGADKAKAGSGPMSFGNKILVVNLKPSANVPASIVLAMAEVKSLGDQWFLTGKAVEGDPPSVYPKQPTHWLRIGDVMSIQEYEDLDDYRKAFGK